MSDAITERRRRTNIDKQERVVTLLWNFAHDLQTKPHNCTACKSGTTVNLDAVGDALRGIMDNFGYDVLEVQ